MASGEDAEPTVRQAGFDHWAPYYDQSSLQRVLYEPVHLRVLAHARRRVPQPNRILDIGCGTGRLARSCAQFFPGVPVIGIDPSAAMIQRAATSAPPTYFQARAEALPFSSDTFDLVVTTLALRHWQDPCLGLAELSRVTTSNGVVVIADARISDVLPKLPSAVATRNGRPRPLTRLISYLLERQRGKWADRLPAALLHALDQAGLRAVHVEPLAYALATATLIVSTRRPARPRTGLLRQRRGQQRLHDAGPGRIRT
ncbi:methyltransferase domain-containing protein [Streptomyces sp. NPDC050625]|uniref:class I SAM-dependent methyltransferase n=1 Tax=Streptomyces sp. NPDC050625 TaxID=3154629 RepID=UPI003449CB9A